VRRIGVVNGVGAAGQDDAFGLPVELGDLLGARQHFRVDIEFSQTARNEVSVLRTIISSVQAILLSGRTRRGDAMGVTDPKSRTRMVSKVL